MRSVSRDHRQRVVFRSRRDECIHKLHPGPDGFTSSYKFSATVGNRGVNSEDSSFEAQGQLLAQPVIELLLSAARCHSFYSVTQLRESNCDQKNPHFICVC